jgi:phosphatidate phosphatase APP1
MELSAALAEPRAFLFLWVNWAIQAQSAHKVVDQFVTEWNSESPDLPIPSYIADVSEQCGELWDALAEWLTKENCPAGQLLMSGVGPILWTRSGRVMLHVLAPCAHERTMLITVTRSVFAP